MCIDRMYVYLSNWVLSRPVDDIVHWPFSADIIDTDELEEGCINETHTHTIPYVHRRQIRHNRQCTAKSIGGCEKIQHGRYAFILEQ